MTLIALIAIMLFGAISVANSRLRGQVQEIETNIIIDDIDPDFYLTEGSASDNKWRSLAGGGYNGKISYNYNFVANGIADSVARWEFVGLIPGTYEVLTTWQEYPFLKTVLYTMSIDEQIWSYEINQAFPPSGSPMFDGVHWKPLGSFDVSEGSETAVLNVEVSSVERGWIVADAVRLRQLRGGIDCGDGVVSSEEECDDGNTFSDDGCSDICTIEVCGDGIVQTGLGEDCDLGRACRHNPTIQCDTNDDCRLCLPVDTDTNRCGGDPAGIACIENSECGETPYVCDVLTLSDQSCTAQCTFHAGFTNTCGNGVIDTGEECDDSNSIKYDGCSDLCQKEFCGDGMIQPGIGEECDDGNTESNDGCSSLCQQEQCGNSIVETDIGEECDDGNRINSDGCNSFCRREMCGDGIVQKNLGEQCDPGSSCRHDVSISCHSNSDCRLCMVIPDTDFKRCGGDPAGILCNTDDECAPSSYVCEISPRPPCKSCLSVPGSTETRCGGDANALPCTDHSECSENPYCENSLFCNNMCLFTYCGDSVVTQERGEECDDGNRKPGDGCSSVCLREFCGDGKIQAMRGEVCDDGNVIGDDGCSSICSFEYCGDTLMQLGIGEECDDGNLLPMDGCSPNCLLEE
jgi:cysteine-rich repeat protein